MNILEPPLYDNLSTPNAHTVESGQFILFVNRMII